jgi:hypothetical protein
VRAFAIADFAGFDSGALGWSASGFKMGTLCRFEWCCLFFSYSSTSEKVSIIRTTYVYIDSLDACFN